jgi:hypothetical protein
MADEREDYAELTALPTYVDEADPFLIIGELKLGLRELLSIITAFVGWFMMAKIMTTILPFFSFGLAAFCWSPFLIAGLALAVGRWQKMSLEKYVSLKLRFMIQPRVYALNDRNAKFAPVEDAVFEDLDY